jgi:hypothetical protein
MGCKIRFVLAPEHTRYFGSKAAQSLTIGIDQYPFFGHSLFIGRNRFVAQCIHYLYIKLNTSSPINGLQMYDYNVE